ncbi:MAG TPA: rRNA pseudouridine synthase [Erysipelothrix sp.]|jgi:16S rRNA pseudouridine516 synthase|nr:rRNA pseudouridine synthase [Erysipelothrix sp.]
MPRLDKILANYQFGSRNDVKKLIKNKQVKVNDELILKDNYIVEENDFISVDSFKFKYHEFVTIMMNKQKNRICTHDSNDITIYDDLDLIYPSNLSSIGRLDKDTTGLIILTNDGQLNHKITSKNNNSIKRYLVTLSKAYQQEPLVNIDLGADGIVSAKTIEVIDEYKIIIGITDGKYHQIKRMIHSIDNDVKELHRLSIGSLKLDESLMFGQSRPMTQEEVGLLYG